MLFTTMRERVIRRCSIADNAQVVVQVDAEKNPV
jgi:hypothetical protein